MIANRKELDEFLLESFKDGRSIRELRLSEAEAEYLKIKIPKATFKKMRDCEQSSAKKWYEVTTGPSK